MDLDYSFNEKAIIIPRNYKINFKKTKSITSHFAIIGIGTIVDDYPLLAEASNEKGLAIAALNFKNNATYYLEKEDKINLAPYELMLYLLAKCENVTQVKLALNNINVIDIDFNDTVKNTPLHFMVSDLSHCIVIETLKDKTYVYDNPYNVLTNNPPFNYQIHNLNNYMSLGIKDPINNFDSNLKFNTYSLGLGALHLPGDYSSSSRFVKTLFIKNNMEMFNNEFDNVKAFFNCLESVKMIKGIVITDKGYEYTRYTSCINLNKSLLYYKTYDNPYINVIDMYLEDIDSSKLIHHELITSFKISKQNMARF